MKIKWNDDRVKHATTALLLISRDRIHHGQTAALIQDSMADFRADPARFKRNQATWVEAGQPGPLTQPQQVAAYLGLVEEVAALLRKMEKSKRQFNSLLELDNYLIAILGNQR